MKAHGITSNPGGVGKASPAAGSGPSTPKTPKTPSGRKAPASSRASSSKKRKLATTSEDVDDDDDNNVKNEVKDEVKHEEADNGSYTMHPTDPHFDAAMESFVKACGEKSGSDIHGVGIEDEIFVVAETCRGHSGPTAAVPVAAPVALVQQMFLPQAPEGFYGFVDHHSSHLHQPGPSHTAVAVTSAPLYHDHKTNCLPQTRMVSEHSTAQWLQQQSLYWNGESPAEMGVKLEWGH